MYIERSIGSILEKSKKSVLLLGPRQTGKSTLISSLKPDLLINLFDESTYLEFARNPAELQQRLASKLIKTVFIDEIQRLPSLLNTIQTLIDSDTKKAVRFFLTGSSARKLKRGHANLLPGRVHTYAMGPLTIRELKTRFNLQQALQTGTLPGIYLEEDSHSRIKTLRSYSGIYLKEEIQAEALTQNLEGFARFLFVAAAASNSFLDLAKLSKEAQIQRHTGVRFFEILEDTLIVNRCEAFSKSIRKRLLQHPKFFFFDTGVFNSLLGNFEASQDRIGALFENLFFNQLILGASSLDRDIRLSSYRTEHGAEVDFIVELDNKVWAIELKASKNVGSNDLNGLKSFEKFFGRSCRRIVAYWGESRKIIENVEILPWQEVLLEMGF